jgi:hypothetical protein
VTLATITRIANRAGNFFSDVREQQKINSKTSMGLGSEIESGLAQRDRESIHAGQDRWSAKGMIGRVWVGGENHTRPID